MKNIVNGQAVDNVGQRMGIGFAVSIGINTLLFVGMAAIKPTEAKMAGEIHWVKPPQAAKQVTPTANKTEKPNAPKQVKPKVEPVKKVEEKEFTRPHQPKPLENTEVQPKIHGPRVVVTPVTPVTPTPATPKKENPVKSDTQSEPKQMALKQSGGQAFVGSSAAKMTDAATTPAESAKPRPASAAAVGGAVSALSTASETAASAPARTATLASVGKASALHTVAYMPVTTIKASAATGTFTVQTVTTSESVSHSAATTVTAAHTEVATAGSINAIHSTSATSSGAVEGSASPVRALRGIGSGQGRPMHLTADIGPALAARVQRIGKRSRCGRDRCGGNRTYHWGNGTQQQWFGDSRRRSDRTKRRWHKHSNGGIWYRKGQSQRDRLTGRRSAGECGDGRRVH